MGTNLLESGDTFSQLAHNANSMIAFNTVPGNAYTMVTPLLAQAGETSVTGDACTMHLVLLAIFVR